MTAITRFRIAIFIIMVLGSFASFAQNEWGNEVIMNCQFIIAASFIWEAFSYLIPRIQQKNRAVINTIEIGLGTIPALLLTILLHGKNDNYTDTIGIFTLWLFVFFPAMGIAEIIFTRITLKEKFLIKLISEQKSIRKALLIQEGYNKIPFAENALLAMFFLSLACKNLFIPGSNITLVVCHFVLILFYIWKTIGFLILNFNAGKMLAILLSCGSFLVILLGLGIIMKILHWPLSEELFYFSFGLSFMFIISLFFIKLNYNKKPIPVIKSLHILNSHIVLMFCIVFIVSSYWILQTHDIAPKFYSQQYPAAIYKTDKNESVEEAARKTELTVRAYNAFIERSEKNGFLK